MSKKGHDITVITADNSVDPSWYKRNYPGIEFKFLEKGKPKWMSGHTSTLKEKIMYHFFIRFINPIMKHNIVDSAFAWGKPLFKELQKTHRNHSIDVLITTGAPFSLLYYGAKFKQSENKIRYIIDFRDPWTWGVILGFNKLSRRKKKFQESMEREAMYACDLACTPSQNMCDFLIQKYPSYSKKVYILPHAFEAEKFPPMAKEGNREGFIYGGTLYDDIEKSFKSIERVLKAHPNTNFKWNIYSNTRYPRIDNKFGNGSVNKFDFIPEEELFKQINNSAAYLVVFNDSNKDFISTKFYEIIYLSIPILYIGAEGAVSNFIKDNRVGIHILPENIEKELPQYLNGNVPFEKGYFNVDQYSFPIVTDNFIQVLENL
ncbi:MAG: hypothetical protein HRU15_13050 [Planctomycetes bacterium]|nr:hypothetical protein [Planctomycetota bacterium]